MEIVNSDISRVPAESDQHVVCRDKTTTRDYVLNQTAALDKKLKATERQTVEVIETGGGLRIVLNTGSYELLKVATDEYFSEIENSRKCKITRVQDKNSAVVETQYKLTAGKSQLYTLNMYHTRSSCLVNGKKLQIFREKDFPEIMHKMEQKLEMNDTSHIEVNESLRKLILNARPMSPQVDAPSKKSSYKLNQPSNVNNNNVDLVESAALLQSENVSVPGGVLNPDSDFENNQSVSSREEADVIEIINDSMNTENGCLLTADAACQTDFRTENNDSNLIVNDMSESLQVFRSFMEETQLQIAGIKDEITSIKKCVNVGNSQLNDRLDSLFSNNTDSSTETKLSIDAMQRRLQSVQDYLRKLPNNLEPAPAHINIISTQDDTQDKSNSVRLPTEADNLTAVNSDNSFNDDMDILSQTQFSTPENSSQQQTPSTRSKTLLIGDSLFKGINARGLCDDVEVETLSGKKTRDVRLHVSNRDIAAYENIVVYVGGNDFASRCHPDMVEEEFRKLESVVQRANENCNLYICTVCPRRDVDVTDLNRIIKAVCDTTSAATIDCHSAFVYGDGNTASHFFHRDGIHLAPRGSSKMVGLINRTVNIIKRRPDTEADMMQNDTTSRQRIGQVQRQWQGQQKRQGQQPPWQGQSQGQQPPWQGQRQEQRPPWQEQWQGQQPPWQGQRPPWQGQWQGQRQQLHCLHCGLNNHLTKDCRRAVSR